MLNRAEKQDKRADVPTAKPCGKPIDIDAGVEKAKARFPKIIARLGR